MNTVITLAPGAQTTVQASPTFSCANVAGSLTQTYTLMGAADAHADDGGGCGAGFIHTAPLRFPGASG